MGTQKSGNFTKGRPALQDAAGNETPERVRNLPRTEADKTPADRASNTPSAEAAINQYNAESTYNESSNANALNHLKDLHQHLTNLWETSQHRGAYMAKSRAAEAYDKATQVGFSAHPDIIGNGEGGTGHIHDIIDRLSNIDAADLPEHARPHLEGAMRSAHAVVSEFTPAGISQFKTHGSDPTRASVWVNPAFRARSFDYKGNTPEELGMAEYKKGMNQTADGKYALVAQGLKAPDTRSPEQMARKAAQRKAKQEAIKAAKLGQK